MRFGGFVCVHGSGEVEGPVRPTFPRQPHNRTQTANTHHTHTKPRADYADPIKRGQKRGASGDVLARCKTAEARLTALLDKVVLTVRMDVVWFGLYMYLCVVCVCAIM